LPPVDRQFGLSGGDCFFLEHYFRMRALDYR
jgi:hypothetical protein